MFTLYYGICITTGQLMAHAIHQGLHREFVRAKGEAGWKEFLDYLDAQDAMQDAAEKAGPPKMGDPNDPELLDYLERHTDEQPFCCFVPKWMADPIKRGWPSGKWFMDGIEDSSPGQAAIEYAKEISSVNGLEHVRLSNVSEYLHFLVSEITWVSGQRPGKDNAPLQPFVSLGRPVRQPIENFMAFEHHAVSGRVAGQVSRLCDELLGGFRIQRWRHKRNDFIDNELSELELEASLQATPIPMFEPIVPACYLVSPTFNGDDRPIHLKDWWRSSPNIH